MKKHPKEEVTYVMLKPDGVRKGLIGEVIKRFEQRDLKIVALEMFQPDFDKVNDHYPKNEEWITRLGNKTLTTYEKYGYDAMKDFGTTDPVKIGPNIRKWLINYMTSAPLVKMIVKGVHAVDVVRKVAGDTMPYKADMGTIRGDFSIDSPALANMEKRAVMNIVHCSETPEEAEHEIKHWFGKSKTHDYKRFGVDE
ncbi:nucleoside-diphosphate kinase [Candidatus Nomurabacteria bacterium RIFCSPHIGHO2_01_FULL_42_15]|uniref:nucleoside-diphosphate kinase n=1 Tax=Candidatus Nomurabacteria bacterium RIFCSPHIGHO2_01_FULL_42_15 TaxID=1801742 RepID=A0A1F6VF69_9BACT|nr:MAG: nucleoside-diphosphate kinase [Candidatus Nomurabacteria bacterium RIFCSPHIGHO2_01_FULL_42_15]OGI93399.1 MAG: nucleoside-diphosphate kinase [Candidatus Nomurabacteria bacterium RIFCSPLOWO2_01_FULL_41_18]